MIPKCIREFNRSIYRVSRESRNQMQITSNSRLLPPRSYRRNLSRTAIREPVPRQSGVSYPSGFRLAGRNDSFAERYIPDGFMVLQNLGVQSITQLRTHGSREMPLCFQGCSLNIVIIERMVSFCGSSG